MPRTPVTVLIHTLDEIENIEACIRSVEWADEIYLLDSFSKDGTIELVRDKFPRVRIEQHVKLATSRTTPGHQATAATAGPGSTAKS